MKLYHWEFKIKENGGTAEVNIKFGLNMKSKDFMPFKTELENLAVKYELPKNYSNNNCEAQEKVVHECYHMTDEEVEERRKKLL